MDCGVKSKIVMASAALVLYSSVSSFSAGEERKEKAARAERKAKAAAAAKK